MRYERLNDRIEVIVHFAVNRVAPLRFLWRGRAHKVTAVRGMWASSEGEQKHYHWAVSAEGVGACELELEVDRMVWTLKSVAIDN